MATVFMKWLETSPRDYERGIRLLTLGRLDRLHRSIAQLYVEPGMRVLEIGCGTGALTARMAALGAEVAAIDASPGMLAEAERRITAAGLADRVTLQQLDATFVGERFEPGSFDRIVASLVFSELSPDELRYVLDACVPILADDGMMLIADEVVPERGLARIPFHLVRWPLAVVTWLLTRTTTRALIDPEAMLRASGYGSTPVAAFLGGSLMLYAAAPEGDGPVDVATAPDGAADSVTCCLPCAVNAVLQRDAQQHELPAGVVGRLRHRVTPRTLLQDLWALAFRIMPPYPKFRTGLYAIGEPGRSSPVLVTGNFDLTVRRVVRAVDGRVDAWLLVADSAGINVWCAAGGGFFTAEKVIAAVKSSHLEDVVDHHALILPQLCANGVDGWKIRQELGWGVHWGPAKAEDIPAYLSSGRNKTDAMRWVGFPLADRLEMVTATLGFYGLMILIPVFLFWRHLFWPATIGLLALSYFYAVALPWIPGRDGLAKSVPLAAIALAGLLVYAAIWDPAPLPGMFNRALGVVALSVFTAGELQGMSPRMRGEQANWGWEAVIAAVLIAAYWIVPVAAGWR